MYNTLTVNIQILFVRYGMYRDMECTAIWNVQGYGMYGDMECTGIWNVRGYGMYRDMECTGIWNVRGMECMRICNVMYCVGYELSLWCSRGIWVNYLPDL